MFIPPSSVNLKNQLYTRHRIGIQGPSGSGKSTSMITFPNLVVINYDDNLSEHFGKDIIEFPIWNPDWVIKYGFPQTKPLKNGHPNRKDALIKILKECQGLTSEQTLGLDSWTTMQDAFDIEQTYHPKITKTGDIDDFDFWAKKIDYSQEVMSYLCSMKCHVVITFHELQTRDPKTGQLLQKIDPLMQGKYVQRLKVPFPNYFRMLAEGETDKEGKEIGCKYYWQVKSDSKFDAKCNLNIPDNVFKIEPTFQALEQYKPKSLIV